MNANHKFAWIAPLALAGAVVAGCSSAQGANAPEAPKTEKWDCSATSQLNQADWAKHCQGYTAPPAAAPAPTSAAPKKSPRGFIPVKYGERNWYQNPDGTTAINIWFDKVTLDPTCDAEMGQKPKNGHVLAIKVRVQTTKDYDPNSGMVGGPSQDSFSVFTPDGTNVPNTGSFEAFSCQDTTLPSGTLAPSSKYSGYVYLDVSSKHGFVDYLSPGPGADGFELTY